MNLGSRLVAKAETIERTSHTVLVYFELFSHKLDGTFLNGFCDLRIEYSC